MELIIFRDSKEVGRLRLSEGTFSIGRGLQNTIALDEQDVSRRHARIRVEQGRVLAEDLGSVNGTFLHGKRIDAPTELDNGDILEIGPYFIQAILDDEFVSHQMERTESHANLRALERSSKRPADLPPEPDRHPQPARKTMNPPERTTTSPPKSAALSSRDQDIAPSETSEDSGDWLAPQELFGLSEDTWLERPPTPGTGAHPPSRRQARATGGNDRGSNADADGILIPVDDVFPSETPVTLDDGPDDIELVELEEPDHGADGAVGAHARAEALDYDDWSKRGNHDNEDHHLPNTPNLADQDLVSPAGAETQQDLDPETPRLVAREGFAKQDIYLLGDGTFYIGRADEMDIVLLDTNASRRHAVIARDPDGFRIRDLWSLNGIQVNGRRVESASLRSGDRIQIGDTVLEFVWPAQPLGPTEEQTRSLPSSTASTTTAAGDPSTPSSRADTTDGADAAMAAGPTKSHPPPRSSPPGAAPADRADATDPRPPPAPPGRHRPRGHKPRLSPTAAVAAITVAIVLMVLGVLALRDREQPSPRISGVAPGAHPVLPGEAVQLIARAKAELSAGEYASALDTAVLAQATAPGARDTTALIHQVCEAWTVDWLEQRLVGLSHPTPPPETEPTTTPGPEAEQSNVAAALPARHPAGNELDATVSEPAPRRPDQVATAAPRVTKSSPREPSGSSQAARKPVPSSALDRRVAALYQKGIAARDQGRYLEAVHAFEKAMAEDTFRESELYYTIEDEMQRAVEQLHVRARPLVAEAARLEDTGQLTEARQMLADALSKDPYYTPAKTRLRRLERRLVSEARSVLQDAEAREKEGDIAGAVEAYRRVLALVPDPSSVYHQTAAQRLEQLE